VLSVASFIQIHKMTVHHKIDIVQWQTKIEINHSFLFIAGYLRGPVYPEGPWRANTSVQRGSVW
jgi:hypothetical protein